MSYYLQIDDHDLQPLASLSGWGDVIRWVETLPVPEARCLHHLTTYGWENDVKGVAAELSSLASLRPPTSVHTQDTLKGMIALLKGQEKAIVMSVTDGIG